MYELTEAVGERRPGEALRVLGRLLSQGEAPLALLAALSQHVRRLLRAAQCRPLNARSVQEALSLHPYAAERLVAQLRRFEPVRLRAALQALRRTDEELKGVWPIAPRTALEQLILEICGA